MQHIGGLAAHRQRPIEMQWTLGVTLCPTGSRSF